MFIGVKTGDCFGFGQVGEDAALVLSCALTIRNFFHSELSVRFLVRLLQAKQDSPLYI